MLAVPAVPVERRRMPRISTSENGGLLPVDLGGSAGLVLDASPTGLLVHSLDPLIAGSRVNVGLWVAGSDSRLVAGAQVVWSDEDGRAGLNLVDPPPQWAAHITELLGCDDAAADAVPRAASPHPAATTAQSRFDLDSVPPPPAEPTQADFLSFVEQALTITEADGAALALQQNEGIYCVASSGRAPAVGARLNPVSGISGECYRTAQPVVCSDAEHDARISAEAARRLNLRSLAVVPVLREGKAIGLLQVLSQRAAAFSDVHVELLDYIADQAGRRVHPAPAPPANMDHTVPPAEEPKVAEHPRLQDLPSGEDVSPLAASIAAAAAEPGIRETDPAEDVRVDHRAVTDASESPASNAEAPIPSFAMVSSAGPSFARWIVLVLLFLALAAAAVWYFVFPQESPGTLPAPPPAVVLVAEASTHGAAAGRLHLLCDPF